MKEPIVIASPYNHQHYSETELVLRIKSLLTDLAFIIANRLPAITQPATTKLNTRNGLVPTWSCRVDSKTDNVLDYYVVIGKIKVNADASVKATMSIERVVTQTNFDLNKRDEVDPTKITEIEITLPDEVDGAIKISLVGDSVVEESVRLKGMVDQIADNFYKFLKSDFTQVDISHQDYLTKMKFLLYGTGSDMLTAKPQWQLTQWSN